MLRTLASALALLATLPASAQPATAWPQALAAPDEIRVFHADADWAIAVGLSGFTIDSALQGPATSMARLASEDGWMTSVILEPSPDAEDASACRAIVRKRARRVPLLGTDLRERQLGPMALLESTVHRIGGVELGQRHVHAFLDVDDTCVDVHVSKVGFGPADEARLEAILGAVALRRPFRPGALDWLPFGLSAAASNECPAALAALENALTADAARPVLDQATWRVVVESRARCLRQSDRLAEVESLIAQALARDPAHAPFLYEHAAVAAARGDAAATLASLERAVGAASAAGLRLGDPRAARAFHAIDDDPAFRAGVARLWPAPPEPHDVPFDVGPRRLRLRLPGGWNAWNEPAEPPRGDGIAALTERLAALAAGMATIEIEGPRGAREAVALLTLMGSQATSRAEVNRLFRASLGPARQEDDDGDLHGRTLEGDGTSARCLEIVDRELVGKEPPPGEWRVVTQCSVMLHEIPGTFTIFTQSREAPEITTLLEVLRTAQR